MAKGCQCRSDERLRPLNWASTTCIWTKNPTMRRSRAPPRCSSLSPSLPFEMSTNAITQTVPRKKKVKSPNEDPTEGDGRRWVTGVKFEFLTGRLPLWHDARDFGEMSNFYSRVTLLFVRFFTWEHALDPDGNGPAEEPSEDNLN